MSRKLMEITTQNVFDKYYLNVLAHTNGYEVNGQTPDEWLMRSIEENLNITEVGADDFRKSFICWHADFREAHNSYPRPEDWPGLGMPRDLYLSCCSVAHSIKDKHGHS